MFPPNETRHNIGYNFHSLRVSNSATITSNLWQFYFYIFLQFIKFYVTLVYDISHGFRLNAVIDCYSGDAEYSTNFNMRNNVK